MIKNMLLPISRARKGKQIDFRGVTIHNTGNNDRGADATANATYLLNNCNNMVNGWHFTVDEKIVIRSIPEDEVAEHSGTRKLPRKKPRKLTFNPKL